MLIFLLGIVTLLAWLHFFYKKPLKDFGNTLPGPPGLPFLGNALSFIGTPVEFLSFVVASGWKYGKRFRTFAGPDLMVILSDPKDVEVILTSMQLLDKADDYKLLYPWLGLGLLTSTGERWHKHRKFLTPAFHFNILRHFVPIFDRKTDLFVKKLEHFANNEVVDIYPMVLECTLSQLAESAMGTSLDDLTEKNSLYVNAVKEMSEIMNERMKSVFIRYDPIFKLNHRYPKYKKALTILHDFTNSMIDKRRQYLKETGQTLEAFSREDDIGTRKSVAFLDLLLLADLDGSKMDDISIREEVDTFLFEGHDTTASCIAFTMYLLADNLEIQEKLYQEQVAVFADNPSRETSYRDINEMKYLDMAVRETLRIFPSVPLIARQITRDTAINDMMIPAGTGVVINIINMNRDPEVFPEPLQYKPERYLPDEVKKRNPYSNVSFSAGPRNCIGQKFAMYEMKMTMSKLLRNYKFTSAHGPPLQLAGDIVLKSANGIHVRLEKRNK